MRVKEVERMKQNTFASKETSKKVWETGFKPALFSLSHSPATEVRGLNKENKNTPTQPVSIPPSSFFLYENVDNGTRHDFKQEKKRREWSRLTCTRSLKRYQILCG